MKLIYTLVAAMAVACAHANVLLLQGDAEGEHSFDTAGHWSDGAAPHANDGYIVSLDEGARLRVPTTIITDSAQGETIDFAGDTLAIGTATTPGEMYVTHAGYATLNVNDLRLVNGTIWAASNDSTYYYPNQQKKQLISGTATVTSPFSNPFTFAPMGSAIHSGIHLAANLVGDESTAIRVLSTNATGATAWMHLSIAGNNSDYHGRFIIEGGQARLWPGWCVCDETTFGATPETFMKDCIIFRNGGGIHTEVSTSFNLKGKNRGIWIEGSANFSSQGSYTIEMPIGGDALSVAPHQNAGIILSAPLTCSKINISNGACILTDQATIGSEVSVIQIDDNGALGFYSDRTVKVRYNSSGRGGFVYHNYSMMGSKLPVVTLTDDSEWVEGKNTCRLRLGSATIPYGRGAPEWMPVLKVPFAVKDLSSVTFVAAEFSGVNTRPFLRTKVETDAETGMQTVYIGQAYYYLVNTNNRPSGHAAKWPYDTWKTAATDLYTVITTAVSRAGGVISVGEGTYNCTEGVTIFSQVKIGNTTYSSPYVIQGVNFNTMEPSPEKVIFDGGYPARSNLIFTISSLANCALRDVTIQRGGRYSTDGNWGGGGAIYAQGMRMDSYVDGCRFLNNFSHHGGVAQASGGIWTNCYFSGNDTSNGSSCFTNPQGAASEDGTYLTCIDCTFENNGPSPIGSGRNLRVKGCTFRKNGDASKPTSGIVAWSYFGELSDCVFEDNIGNIQTSNRNQGFWHIQKPMTNLVFRRNTTTGPMIEMRPNVYLEPSANFLFESNTCQRLLSVSQGFCQLAAWGNTCSSELIAVNDSAARAYALENMTLADNTAPVAIKVNTTANAVRTQVLNSILWGNRTTAGAVTDSSVTIGSRILSVDHCCYEGSVLDLYADAGCFKVNPKLTSTYGIEGTSRCRDSGLNQPWMTAEAKDLAGVPRRLNRQGKKSAEAIVDMGAYESTTPMPGFIVVFR